MSGRSSVDIVIIGLNSARTLASCIDSVNNCNFVKRNGGSVYYVDGGSSDSSLDIAESHGCTCLVAKSDAPTPGRQRNEGWRHGSSDYVQFLDSDTVLDADWLDAALDAIAVAGVGAVNGNRRELHPEASFYNWIGNLEWNGEPGDAETFGGDVLVARSALESTGGYDPDLVAGEDPELSYRIRRSGYRIVKLDKPMTGHDLAMRTLGQYWKRSFRSGHAFAEVHARHRDFWGDEVRRITVRTVPLLVGCFAAPLALLLPWLILALPLGALVLVRPRLLLVPRFEEGLGLSREEARAYAWHASFVVLPQFFGMLRFYLGRLFGRPLRNTRKTPGISREEGR